MRSTVAMAVIWIAACGNPAAPVDAQVSLVDSHEVDSKPIDAAIDAAPDATGDAADTAIATACDHVCLAITSCVMTAPDPACNAGCEADLVDCTPQQVMQVDACSSAACGDLQNNMSPLLDCLAQISCVMG